VIFAVVARLTRSAIRTTGLGPLDHLLGVVLGLILGGLIVGSTVWGIQVYDLEWKNLLQDSKLTADALNFFKWVMAWTQKFFPRPEIGIENVKEIPFWRRKLW